MFVVSFFLVGTRQTLPLYHLGTICGFRRSCRGMMALGTLMLAVSGTLACIVVQLSAKEWRHGMR